MQDIITEHSINRSEEALLNLTISQIDDSAQSMYTDGLAVCGSLGAIVNNREQFAQIIDLPALKAVESLYDKNIQTLNSSANRNDKEASIRINYDSLSEENKIIAKEIVANGLAEGDELDDETGIAGRKIVKIEVPMELESSVKEISESLNDLTTHFKKQDILFGRISDVQEWLDEAAKANFVELSEVGDTVAEQISMFSPSSYYDEENDEIFASKDLYNKHIEYLKSLQN